MDANPADQMAGEVKFAPLDSIPPAPPSMSDTGADAGSEAPVNPRKRKKASRACDYCHTNHQPCDNGTPRCSVCEKHNKMCEYLRPTKRRGPQKGYRTALNTYKESAAAWGAVLGAIPGLDALIEGHLRTDNGRGLLKTIKDPTNQDGLIQSWQNSTVFKTFFPNADTNTIAGSVAPGEEGEVDDDVQMDASSGSIGKQAEPQPDTKMLPAFGAVDPDLTGGYASYQHHYLPIARESTSLSDIVAKDAARSISHASQTLAPLGFAPNETIADFYDIGSNPEIMQSPGFDFNMGTDDNQRVYYELLMGRSFGDSSQP